jgi:alkylated DNA repair dioxygenase AlkB
MKVYEYLGKDDNLIYIDVNILWSQIPWVKLEDSPRFEYWYAKDGRSYTYGKGRGVRTYFSLYPFTNLYDIWNIIETKLNTKFQGCFVNGYKDGHDHLGWHSDDGPDIDQNNSIAVVTFGAEREIWIREIKPKYEYTVQVDNKIKLENGSIFVMEPGCQQTHQHRIPKAGFECGPRISFTFRGLVDKS